MADKLSVQQLSTLNAYLKKHPNTKREDAIKLLFDNSAKKQTGKGVKVEHNKSNKKQTITLKSGLSVDVAKGASVETKEGKITLSKTGRYSVTGKDGKTKYYAANGTELNEKYFKQIESSTGNVTVKNSKGVTVDVNKRLQNRIARASKELQHEEDNQGLIGKLWSGTKNTFGFGDSSDKVQQQLKQEQKLLKQFNQQPQNRAKIFKQLTGLEYNTKNMQDFVEGKIQLQSEKNLDGYKEGQATAVDVATDVVSGIASFAVYSAAVAAAPFTGGASIVAGVAVAGAVGAGTKVALKAGETVGTDKKYDSLGHDLIMGAANGAISTVTAGLGGAVAKTLATRMGLEVVKAGAKEVAKQGTKQVVSQATKQAAKTGFKRAFSSAVKGAKEGLINPGGYKYVAKDGVKNAGLKKFGAYMAEGATDGGLSGGAISGVETAHNGGSAEDVIKATAFGALSGAVMGGVMNYGMNEGTSAVGKLFKGKAKTTTEVAADAVETSVTKNADNSLTTGGSKSVKGADDATPTPKAQGAVSDAISQTEHALTASELQAIQKSIKQLPFMTDIEDRPAFYNKRINQIQAAVTKNANGDMKLIQSRISKIEDANCKQYIFRNAKNIDIILDNTKEINEIYDNICDKFFWTSDDVIMGINKDNFQEVLKASRLVKKGDQDAINYLYYVDYSRNPHTVKYGNTTVEVDTEDIIALLSTRQTYDSEKFDREISKLFSKNVDMHEKKAYGKSFAGILEQKPELLEIAEKTKNMSKKEYREYINNLFAENKLDKNLTFRTFEPDDVSVEAETAIGAYLHMRKHPELAKNIFVKETIQDTTPKAQAGNSLATGELARGADDVISTPKPQGVDDGIHSQRARKMPQSDNVQDTAKDEILRKTDNNTYVPFKDRLDNYTVNGQPRFTEAEKTMLNDLYIDNITLMDKLLNEKLVFIEGIETPRFSANEIKELLDMHIDSYFLKSMVDAKQSGGLPIFDFNQLKDLINIFKENNKNMNIISEVIQNAQKFDYDGDIALSLINKYKGYDDKYIFNNLMLRLSGDKDKILGKLSDWTYYGLDILNNEKNLKYHIKELGDWGIFSMQKINRAIEDGNLKRFLSEFEDVHYKNDIYNIKFDRKNNNYVLEFLDNDLNHHNVEFEVDYKGEITKNKHEFYDSDSYYDRILEFENGEKIITKGEEYNYETGFTKEYIDKSGSLLRKEEIKPSGIRKGEFDITVTKKESNGDYVEDKIGSVKRFEDINGSRSRRRVVAPDGTITRQIKLEEKRGLSTSYDVISSEGEILYKCRRSHVKVDENHYISNHNGQRYDIQFNDNEITVQTLDKSNNTIKTVVLDSETFDKELLPLMKKLPGDYLVQLKELDIKVKYSPEVSDVYYKPYYNTIYLHNVEDGFAFAHEFGHALDEAKLGGLEYDDEFIKLYEEAVENFKKQSTYPEGASIAYFTGSKGKSETIAEIMALVSGLYDETVDLGIRSVVLQQNFAKPLAYAAKKLEAPVNNKVQYISKYKRAAIKDTALGIKELTSTPKAQAGNSLTTGELARGADDVIPTPKAQGVKESKPHVDDLDFDELFGDITASTDEYLNFERKQLIKSGFSEDALADIDFETAVALKDLCKDCDTIMLRYENALNNEHFVFERDIYNKSTEYLEGDSNAKKMALLVLSSNPKYQAIFDRIGANKFIKAETEGLHLPKPSTKMKLQENNVSVPHVNNPTEVRNVNDLSFEDIFGDLGSIGSETELRNDRIKNLKEKGFDESLLQEMDVENLSFIDVMSTEIDKYEYLRDGTLRKEDFNLDDVFAKKNYTPEQAEILRNKLQQNPKYKDFFNNKTTPTLKAQGIKESKPHADDLDDIFDGIIDESVENVAPSSAKTGGFTIKPVPKKSNLDNVFDDLNDLSITPKQRQKIAQLEPDLQKALVSNAEAFAKAEQKIINDSLGAGWNSGGIMPKPAIYDVKLNSSLSLNEIREIINRADFPTNEVDLEKCFDSWVIEKYKSLTMESWETYRKQLNDADEIVTMIYEKISTKSDISPEIMQKIEQKISLLSKNFQDFILGIVDKKFKTDSILKSLEQSLAEGKMTKGYYYSRIEEVKTDLLLDKLNESLKSGSITEQQYIESEQEILRSSLSRVWEQSFADSRITKEQYDLLKVLDKSFDENKITKEHYDTLHKLEQLFSDGDINEEQYIAKIQEMLNNPKNSSSEFPRIVAQTIEEFDPVNDYQKVTNLEEFTIYTANLQKSLKEGKITQKEFDETYTPLLEAKAAEIMNKPTAEVPTVKENEPVILSDEMLSKLDNFNPEAVPDGSNSQKLKEYKDLLDLAKEHNKINDTDYANYKMICKMLKSN